MSLKNKQAKVYLEEAELSLESARASMERARSKGKELWHSVVKACYDAMEQAI